jgi:hypothetical protein
VDTIKIIQKVKNDPTKNTTILTARIASVVSKTLSDICKAEKLKKSAVIEAVVEEFVESYKKVRYTEKKK